MHQTEVLSSTHWGTVDIKSPIIPSANSDAPTNSLTSEMFYLLSRQVTLIKARYFAAPLEAGRLNYRPAPEPCIFIVHFDLCYAHLC